MTTDTVPKECAFSYVSDDPAFPGVEVTVGGMVKGAGMIMPNMATMIATITTFVFQCTSIWNEMLFALVLGGYDSKPATIALNELAGTMAAEFNVQMAGSLILALPVLVLYIFMGKYLISGQMSGAVTAS